MSVSAAINRGRLLFARAKPSFAGTKLWFAGSILSFAAAKRKRRHTLRRIFRLVGLPFSDAGARWMVVGIAQVVLRCHPLSFSAEGAPKGRETAHEWTTKTKDGSYISSHVSYFW